MSSCLFLAGFPSNPSAWRAARSSSRRFCRRSLSSSDVGFRAFCKDDALLSFESAISEGRAGGMIEEMDELPEGGREASNDPEFGIGDEGAVDAGSPWSNSC